MTPATRIHTRNDRPISSDGSYVLYWMVAVRRTRFNFGLQRAVEVANELGKPLLILEAIRTAYPCASDRLHGFVIDGMRDNERACRGARARYFPYIEPAPGEGQGLLAAMSAAAALVVTDTYPAFFLPRMISAAASRATVRFEAVDSHGLIPTSTHGRAFPTARGYRAFMQRNLREHLADWPAEAPLDALDRGGAVLPPEVEVRWPPADLRRSTSDLVAHLPVDHSVGLAMVGGAAAADRGLARFLDEKLPRYAREANHPDEDCTSRLSPYLHFGHLSVHEIFSALMTRERWTSRKLSAGAAGAREGWWNVSPSAEQFLDQVTVWRELAFNGAEWTDGTHAFDTLPRWARDTLHAHRADPRPHTYDIEQLDAADTHDAVWNAAQTELRQTGWFHGYMRMVWGKKILEWSRRPEEALGHMEALMNRYSLDGRDPVSSLNYGWVLGRYDRPWFERPIFGTVRYMTSESAKRKLKMKKYLATYGRP